MNRFMISAATLLAMLNAGVPSVNIRDSRNNPHELVYGLGALGLVASATGAYALRRKRAAIYNPDQADTPDNNDALADVTFARGFHYVDGKLVEDRMTLKFPSDADVKQPSQEDQAAHGITVYKMLQEKMARGGLGEGEIQAYHLLQRKFGPKNDPLNDFPSENDVARYKSVETVQPTAENKLYNAYEITSSEELFRIYNMHGMSASRMARDSGMKTNDVYDALAIAKHSQNPGTTYKWNRRLAEKTGDAAMINSIISSGREKTASQLAAEIRDVTGFEVSKSTIYRMKKNLNS
jgi:hypothetical protein